MRAPAWWTACFPRAREPRDGASVEAPRSMRALLDLPGVTCGSLVADHSFVAAAPDAVRSDGRPGYAVRSVRGGGAACATQYVKIAGKAGMPSDVAAAFEPCYEPLLAYLDARFPGAGVAWDGDNVSDASPFTVLVRKLAERGRHCVAIRDDAPNPLSRDFVEGWRAAVGPGARLDLARLPARGGVTKEDATAACCTHVLNLGSSHPDFRWNAKTNKHTQGYSELVRLEARGVAPELPLGDAAGEIARSVVVYALA